MIVFLKMIPFQHSNQCADFILLRLRLDERVVKCLVAQVVKRIEVQLVVPIRRTLILNERRSVGIARDVDGRSIYRQQTIAAKVSASSQEVLKRWNTSWNVSGLICARRCETAAGVTSMFAR